MDRAKIFIEKAILKHGDKYDYLKVNYINSNTEVEIICNKHGSFWQKPVVHLQQKGCLNCSFKTSTKDEFIEKAKLIHGDEYDYSNVNYIHSKTKIEIICNKHGSFWQRPDAHLQKQGCPECGIEKCDHKTSTTNEFIEKAKLIHGNIYDYSKVNYINSNTKIEIICNKHGSFWQRPDAHLYQSGCPECGSRTFTTNVFIEKAKLIHYDTYDYSNVNYINSYTNVEIICNIHGSFWQSPNVHINKSGCPKCGFKTSTTNEFIEKAKLIHGDEYDYSNVNYIHYKELIEIICNKHGSFWQSPHAHLRQSGCPICQLCPSCELWKTNGKLCSYCKPKNINIKYKKTKEYAVVNFLKEKLPDNEFIHNKSVGKDCTEGHLYPDIRFDCNHYQLIVEIDEHKHRGADYKCDEQRMYDIIAKLGMPCIFIRYNPDSKQSDKNVLLEKVKEYLELSEDNEIWDKFGLYTEYLYYS